MEERKQLREKPFQAGRNQWGDAGRGCRAPRGRGRGETSLRGSEVEGPHLPLDGGSGGKEKPPPLCIPMDAEPPGPPPPASSLPLLHTA